MDAITFGLALGVTSSLFWPLLPNNLVIILLLGLAFVCIFYRYRFLCALLIGAAWAAFFFHCTTNWLQNENISLAQKHLLQITVQDLQHKHDNYQIIADIESINGHQYWWHPKVKLSASNIGQQLNTNDRLLIQASLKLPHNLNNPGSFDSVRWLLGKGITATGKIIEVRRLEKSETGWRDRWIKQVQSQLRLLQSSGLIMALIFGEQHLVELEEWNLLRNHGLIHLMAISGMHIGLIGWFGMILSRFITQKFHQISPQLHWIPGLLFASFYAALANFSIPTERALFMLFIFVGLKLWRRQWSGIRIWLLAMSILVLFDPWAIFSTGFWLSFLAVAVLALSSFLWKNASMLRIQIFITLMLLPVQLLWFHGVSITSVFMNILAGPWFSFSIIPLSVLGGFIAPIFPVMARYCFYMSDWQLQQLFNLLHVTDDYFSGWMSLSEVQTHYVLWMMVLVLLLFIARSYRKSVVFVVGVSGLVLVGCEQKPLWRMDFIDVGQGLAVLVSQDSHGLLFDTGDAFPSGFNMADAAIFPVLSYRGIQYLDYLIISHKDRDHSGNWEKISQSFPQAQIISSAQLSPETTICKKNMVIRWQRLVMHVVSPVESKGGDHNEDSCVIRISDGNKSVLLTGDVEKRAEHLIAQQDNALIKSDFLSSPHHGSHSSSTTNFIRKVSPQYVIHSAGYLNRWKHPHTDIVERYSSFGIKQFSTARDGMISVAFYPDRYLIDPYRINQPWYQSMDTWLVSDQPVK